MESYLETVGFGVRPNCRMDLSLSISRSCLKLFYFACNLAIVLTLFWQLVLCCQKFLAKSTYFDVSMVEQRRGLFPDLTLCSGASNGLKLDVLKSHGFDNQSGIKDYVDGYWSSNTTNVTPQSLWKLVSFNLEELIESVKVQTWSGMSIKAINTKINGKMSVSHINVKIQRSRREGQCYTLNMDQYVRNFEIRRVKIIGYGF